MLRNVFVAFGLTVAVGVVSGLISSPDFFFQSGALLFTAIVIGLIYGLPNVVVLLLLRYLKIVKQSLHSIPFIIAEVFMLFVMVTIVHKLVAMVPYEERFEITPTITSIKPYYGEGAMIIYAFVLTLLIMVPLARLTKLFDPKQPATTT